MQVLVFHAQDLSDIHDNQGHCLLKSFPANQLLLRMVVSSSPFQSDCGLILIPETFKSPDLQNEHSVLFYPSADWKSHLSFPSGSENGSDWIFSNAGVLTGLDQKWLQSIIAAFEWDVLAIRVDPALAGSREQVKLTSQGHIVGFRRQYEPSAEPDYSSDQWPDHLFCKSAVLQRLRQERTWNSYPAFLEICEKNGLNYRSIRVGGRRLDLFSPAGQLELLEFSQTCPANGHSDAAGRDPSIRIYGRIHSGRNVEVDTGTVIIAPAILCDGAVIGSNTVLQEALIGPSVHVPENTRVRRQSLLSSSAEQPLKIPLPISTQEWNAENREDSVFRGWTFFSYPRFGKRLFDLLASLCILMLFIPFFPVIALAVKLTSAGPVFYRARRQGIHGKDFDCLKFRTMLEKADSMQEQLRFASQVDGPQFKIEDDPRISPIGKFLRDTCIDELPQFLNVLAGQMSIVGPRPSPESENEFCPPWRDARLSVKPGITGMWQVKRTRESSMDFQEWIRYDTEYVRRISFRTDVWICYKTAQMLISRFLDQFG